MYPRKLLWPWPGRAGRTRCTCGRIASGSRRHRPRIGSHQRNCCKSSCLHKWLSFLFYLEWRKDKTHLQNLTEVEGQFPPEETNKQMLTCQNKQEVAKQKQDFWASAGTSLIEALQSAQDKSCGHPLRLHLPLQHSIPLAAQGSGFFSMYSLRALGMAHKSDSVPQSTNPNPTNAIIVNDPIPNQFSDPNPYELTFGLNQWPGHGNVRPLSSWASGERQKRMPTWVQGVDSMSINHSSPTNHAARINCCELG